MSKRPWNVSEKSRLRTLAHNRWRSMIRRCTDPRDSSWQWYGGRGIKVCDAWMQSFQAFYDAVGDAPAGHSLDRKDSDKDYEPGNVTWSTFSEQSYNRRDHNRLKTECDYGHPFNEANTYWFRGHRSCRACNRRRVAESKARRLERAS